jgi:hypothetical protein
MPEDDYTEPSTFNDVPGDGWYGRTIPEEDE